jgi:nuclear pore complex protein Nup107
LDEYERAIYGFFSGRAQYILPVCTTWEDQVWAYYASMIEYLVDKKLSKYPRGFPGDNEMKIPSHSELCSPQEIFENIAKSDKASLSEASNNPFRIIQMMIILDRLEDLIHATKVQLETSADMDAISHVLRFMAHLIIMMRSIGYSNHSTLSQREDENIILQYYIRYLIKEDKVHIYNVDKYRQ